MSFTPYEQSGSLFLIALNSRNKIVGTIGVLNTNKSNEVKLNSLYIDKAYRKCGIGKKLYELAQNYINEQKYKTIILHTYNKFADAIRFYEKNGFAIFDKDEEGFWYKKEL
jgi:ribosomal protein S18 acetylase RimI-like enzyme